MKPLALTLVVAAGVALANVRAAEPVLKLRVGDPAPALKVGKWFKGAPVEQFETGQVYVVEFWATWAGPSLVTIPHLTEVAKEFKDKATVIGVSVWEVPADDATRFKTVGDFVTKMGDRMNYHIAADVAEKFMANNWLEAALERGIPASFIVDQRGKVAWIGHSSDGLEKVLTKVVEGAYDGRADAAKHEQEKIAAARQDDLLTKILKLYQSGNRKDALESLDKAIADHPEYKRQTLPLRYLMLLDTDEEAGYAFARELAGGEYKDNPGMLVSLSRGISDRNTKLKKPNYELAMALAKQADEIAQGKNPAALSAMAEVQFRTHKYSDAIETMKKAMVLAENSESPLKAQQLAQFKSRLDRFQTMKDKRETKATTAEKKEESKQ